jgi:hypothetical protein
MSAAPPIIAKGNTLSYVAGENLRLGLAVGLDASGHVIHCDNTAPSPIPCIGVTVDDALQGETVWVQISGTVTVINYAGVSIAPGDLVGDADNTGALQSQGYTIPASGSSFASAGICLAADVASITLQVMPQSFGLSATPPFGIFSLNETSLAQLTKINFGGSTGVIHAAQATSGYSPFDYANTISVDQGTVAAFQLALPLAGMTIEFDVAVGISTSISAAFAFCNTVAGVGPVISGIMNGGAIFGLTFQNTGWATASAPSKGAIYSPNRWYHVKLIFSTDGHFVTICFGPNKADLTNSPCEQRIMQSLGAYDSLHPNTWCGMFSPSPFNDEVTNFANVRVYSS